MGRRTYHRDFSSVSEKGILISLPTTIRFLYISILINICLRFKLDVPMGDLELFVNNVAGLCFKGASDVVGFVLGKNLYIVFIFYRTG